MAVLASDKAVATATELAKRMMAVLCGANGYVALSGGCKV
jgi:hypothetical protein